MIISEIQSPSERSHIVFDLLEGFRSDQNTANCGVIQCPPNSHLRDRSTVMRRHRPHVVYSQHVLLVGLSLIMRKPAAPVGRSELRLCCVLAGQHTLGQSAVGDDADAELLATNQDFLLRAAVN